MTTQLQAVQKRKRRGFTLVEVYFAVIILLFMALMFAAVVPTSLRSIRSSNYYNLAAMVAQRKLDQLMDPAVGYSALTIAGLDGTQKPEIVIISPSNKTSADPCEYFDPNPVQTGTVNKTDYKLVSYFTKVDGLRKYTSNGTQACSDKLNDNAFPGDTDVVGQLVIEGWQGNTSAATDSHLMKATVTITWRTHGQGKSTYTAMTLIPETSIL